MGNRNFLIHSQPLILHLPHNLPGLLILKLIQLVSVRLFTLPGLFLPLLFLLHHDLVSDHFLHDDVVEDVAQKVVLHGCKLI